MEPHKMPTCVFIQTQTGCNARCLMCPNVSIAQKIPFQKMEDSLYKKIIDELGELDYDKEVGLYLMYEPLADRSIFERIDYIKEKCPKAAPVISTNASLLNDEMADKLLDSKIRWIVFNVNGMTKEIYEKTMPGMNFETTFTNIRNFVRKAQERGKQIPTYESTVDKIRNKLTKKTHQGDLYMSANFVQHKLNTHEVPLAKKFWHDLKILVHTDYWAVNRAGNVEGYDDLVPEDVNTCEGKNSQFKGSEGVLCDQPFMHVDIMSNGKMILCSNDWMRTEVVGDLNHQSLMEVWNGPKYREYREKLHTRQELPEICKKCKR